MSESRARRLADRIRSGGFLADDLVQAVPDRLGRYEVLRPLGEGATSEVYLARDPTMDREVALKILLGLDTDPVRFQREMEVLAALEHPGIVRIYDSGRHGERSFFVMEYLGERSLADVVGALSVDEALDVVAQVAEACHAAHEQGVVHRDLKPSNVLLADRPVVVDFGVAKLLDPAGGKKGKTTRAGSAVGTPHYMAPEQVSDQQVDRRTDVYALGVILYELTTGELPHRGANFTDLALKICEEEPRAPRARNPALPAAVEAVILKALAKDPAERYPDARALAAALRGRGGGDPAAGREGPAVRVPYVVAVAAGAVGLALGLALGRGTAPRAPAATPAVTPEATPTGALDRSNAAAIARLRDEVAAWERVERAVDAEVPVDALRALLARPGLRVTGSSDDRQRALALRARVLHDLGDRRAAGRAIEEALALDAQAGVGAARLQRAWIGWERLQAAPLRMAPQEERDRLLRAVVDDLRAALAADEPSRSRRAGAEALLELAQAWRAKQRERAAARLDAIERAELAPPRPQLHLLRAQLAILGGERGPALELLEQARATRFQLTITTAAQALLHLTAPQRGWRELALATRVVRAALAASPTSPDLQRLTARVLRLWILSWHAAGGRRVQLAPGTRAALAALRARLKEQSASAAREADLTLALFAALAGADAPERERLSRAASAFADTIRGAEAGVGPWATVAHILMWRCAPSGGQAAPARRELGEVLRNARRWFPADGELDAIGRVAARYGVKVPK